MQTQLTQIIATLRVADMVEIAERKRVAAQLRARRRGLRLPSAKRGTTTYGEVAPVRGC